MTALSIIFGRFIYTMREKMPVTISDVALSAGVSIKTVSRVLNREINVSEPTRNKVLAAIETLGYIPNPSAQGLARGHTGAVGVLIHDATPSYIMEVLNGLIDVGDDRGYRISLHRCDITNAEDVDRVIRSAAQRQVEGMIFTPPCDNSAEIVSALETMGLPFVQLTPHERSDKRAWIAADDEHGAYAATHHLLELGHRRIGFIQGSINHQASWDRFAGFRRALQSYGLEPDQQLIRQGDWSYEAGLINAEKLLAMPQRPTAIIAANDEVAAGAIQTAWRMGVPCPEQLSVVGFDDVPLAKQIWPPLTTVSQPIYLIAKVAMSMLIDTFIQGDGNISHVEVPTRLIVRQSTAQAPGGGRS